MDPRDTGLGQLCQPILCLAAADEVPARHLLSTGDITHLTNGGIVLRGSLTRRIAYFCWALLIVAGLSFNSAQAEALHNECADICESQCGGEGKCRDSRGSGCVCRWSCSGGGSGVSICLI